MLACTPFLSSDSVDEMSGLRDDESDVVDSPDECFESRVSDFVIGF